MLELRLLGVAEIELDGTPVTFVRRGTMALLAYLAVSQRAHPRDLVATLLAGDSSEEQARKYLSNALVDLRQQLGEYIIASRQTVAFNAALPHRLDVVEFKRRAAAWLADDDAAELEAALGLYRDDFLTGLTLPGGTDFERWQYAQHEELRGQYVQLLQAQVEACIRRSAWSSGIAAGRQLLAREPWLENAHRQLMLMLARSGQPRAAIAQYLECRRALRDELGVQPVRETTALFNRLRAAVVPPLHNLPVPAAPLVGRREQVSLLLGLLAESNHRLMTITGLGGSGKTRLAVEVARRCASPGQQQSEHTFADGIAFVQLGTGADAPSASEAAGRHIVRAIGMTLGIGDSGQTKDPAVQRLGLFDETVASGEAVVDYLRGRAVLLVLDNLEHFRAGADALDDLLAQAPYVKVLATSRVPLQLPIEHVLHVDGLPVPDSADELEQSEASALFLQEARRVQLDYSLSADERPHLVRLCALLGGFPLGLVLAARWTPLLTCAALAAELGRGLNLLATSEADLPERHRGLATVLEETLRQLPADEQHLVRVLAESPDPDASRTRSVPPELLPRLAVLREQGLLCPDRAGSGLTLHPLLPPYFRGIYADHRLAEQAA
jgi:DNA-binding SARP family transcriptional activator/predicted ATPase